MKLTTFLSQKSARLSKINAFAAKHGLNLGFLADLIHEQYLSDEASGPEDDSTESQDTWKVRMASQAVLPLDPDSQKQMKILEILTPAWRSGSYSRLIRAMEEFVVDDSSLVEDSYIYHRVGVARVQVVSRTVFLDWNKYPEPDDCGLVLERDENGTIVNAHFSSGNE
ncbi:hypothetical protein B0H13DRAFT_2306937 [Mycena leptocephala]|nr:hypothetical protein B0H13DRAFT_2306937 [Mycena leptocephala]